MIIGEKVRFRAIEREDLPTFVRWLNDPEVRQGLIIYLPLSQVEEEQWFEGVLKRSPDERPMVIEIATGDEWVAVGNCNIFDIDWRVRCAEVGIFIGEKRYWNQGFGTETMKLLLKHGFRTLNLNRIFLKVYENNPRALRAYEKVGFIHEGCLRQAHYYDGKYVDAHIMSVLRQEWEDSEHGKYATE